MKPVTFMQSKSESFKNYSVSRNFTFQEHQK